MLDLSVDFIIMSGIEDGSIMRCATDSGDGVLQHDCWTVSIGRLDSCDLRITTDTFVSREHARVHWRDRQWWLEDLSSRNGTYLLNPQNFFEDSRVNGIVPIQNGQIFRVGRTWLRLMPRE